jgi:peroxiredoxin
VIAWLAPSSRSAFAEPEVRATAENGPPIHGIDLDGELHRFGVFGGKRAVVLVFLSTDCPISNGCLPELNRLAKRHHERVDVYGIVSSSSTSRATAIAHRDEYAVEFPILFDASGALRRSLGPTHTPHAFVLNPGGDVVYAGALDDRYAEVGRALARARHDYVSEALDDTLAGRPVARPLTKAVGCLVERAPAAEPTTDVTFERDVAPIVRAHCAPCHRPDQRAPFSLLDYDDVSRHARQIVAVTASKRMPPWKPVANHGEFRNARGLSEREIHLLRTWERNGKPRGEAVDAPPPATYADGWQLGRPDVVLVMKREFEIPADGPDLWQHYVFPSVVLRDRLLTAVEFRPGATAAVHHASFFVDTNHVGRRLDALEPDYGYRGAGGGPLFRPNGVLRSWFPGAHTQHLPEGMGRPVAKGSDLVVEVHYHPTGRVEWDRSQIGLYFAPRTARQYVEEMQVMNTDLDVPAGEAAHLHRASLVLPVDVTLLDTAPHMHLLGRAVSASATRPDGVVVPLVRIDDWDFDWQGSYVYREPLRLPAGTRIDVDFTYDNSAGNVVNPHSPPQRVEWGDGSHDEMAICHFQYTCDTLPDFTRMVRFHDAYATNQFQRYFQRHPERADAERYLKAAITKAR